MFLTANHSGIPFAHNVDTSDDYRAREDWMTKFPNVYDWTVAEGHHDCGHNLRNVFEFEERVIESCWTCRAEIRFTKS